MTTKLKIIVVFLLFLSNVTYSQEDNVDTLLKKYVGEVRYKKIISDEILESSEGTYRHLLIEVGGYHSGKCGSGSCGCAEKSELYLFAIPQASEEKEKVRYETLSNDCVGGPILSVKKKDGHIIIGEERFVTKYIYNRGKVEGAFTDVRLAE